MVGFTALPLLLLLFSLMVFPAHVAFAARGAVVDVDSVELRDGPGPQHKAVETLARGAAVTASNQPIEGYFKVRTASGAIGFVQADMLVLQPLPNTLPDEAAVRSSAVKARKGPMEVRLKLLGGYNFFSIGDFNELLGADVIRFGYSSGGQFELILTPALAVVMRAEYLFKNVTARDRVADKTYDLSVRSLPIMAGVNITLASHSSWSGYFGLMGGLAQLTQLSATSTSEAEPNVTASSAMGYTGMAKLEFVYALGRNFSIIGEGGYRYLTTAQLTPSLVGNGSSIFQSGGVDVPISINLSGPFVGFGAGVAF